MLNHEEIEIVYCDDLPIVVDTETKTNTAKNPQIFNTDLPGEPPCEP